MKTFVLAFVFLSFLSACTPHDNEVVSADQRNLLLSQKNRGSSNSGTAQAQPPAPGQVKLGTYGSATYLFEKQAEILQLLSAVSYDKAQSWGAFSVADSTSYGADVQRVSIAAEKFTATIEDYSFTQTSHWDAFIVFNTDHVANNIWLNLKDSSQNMTQTASGANGVDLTESGSSLQVSFDPVANVSTVVASASGTLKVTIGGVTESMPLTLTANIKVAGVDFKSEKIQINSAEMSMSLTRAANSINIKLTNNGAVTFNNTTCPSILGSASLATDKKPLTVKFDDSKASVGDKYKTNHVACGQRPVIDLRRIAIY